MTLLLVIVGGAAGAVARYLIDAALRARYGSDFPRGTLVANVAGSLLLGLIAGAATGGLPAWVQPLVGAGFCGALTTYSTFGLETVQLAGLAHHHARRWAYASINVAGTLAAGFGAAWLGWLLSN